MSMAIAIFAKYPRPGFAKTRLAASIGPDAAAHLARAMLMETLGKAKATGLVPVVFYTPVADETAMAALLPERTRLQPQEDGDLGARMHAAFMRMQALGHSKTLLVGTDCPLMTQTTLNEAAHCLNRPQDMVLMPTDDGGYGLVGLCHSHEGLFRDIPWSTADVLRLQQQRARECGYACHLLPQTYDIDEVDDLKRLMTELAADPALDAPYLRAALAAMTV